MTKTLEGRKEAALARLMEIGSARRGQLSTQYYTHKKTDGRTVRHGPYYVWQRYVNGKKRSVRVKKEQIEQVKADIERGRDLQDIFDSLFAIMEETAIAQDHDMKKKTKPSGMPGIAKQRPPST
jgi:plasmid stabilization system protein ParE